jgi:hypothetical protein
MNCCGQAEFEAVDDCSSSSPDVSTDNISRSNRERARDEPDDVITEQTRTTLFKLNDSPPQKLSGRSQLITSLLEYNVRVV